MKNSRITLNKATDNGFFVFDVFHKDLSQKTHDHLKEVGPVWNDNRLNEHIYNIEEALEGEDNKAPIGVALCDLTRIKENCDRFICCYFRITGL